MVGGDAECCGEERPEDSFVFCIVIGLFMWYSIMRHDNYLAQRDNEI